MLKNDPDFTRLRKLGGRTSMGSASYWLGRDHLMVVEVSNYNERYRRFYFRDIQAVIVQRNSLRMWGNIILGVLMLLPLVISASLAFSIARWQEGEIAAMIIVGVIWLMLGWGMLVNILRGPTCSTHLRTAVQTQKLMGITRQRRAELLLETIEPSIQQAQLSGAGTAPVATEAVTGDFASPDARPETS